jgi:hypothetical protein
MLYSTGLCVLPGNSSPNISCPVAADGSRRILPAPKLAPTAVGGYILSVNRAKYELSGLAIGRLSDYNGTHL